MPRRLKYVGSIESRSLRGLTYPRATHNEAGLLPRTGWALSLAAKPAQHTCKPKDLPTQLEQVCMCANAALSKSMQFQSY